MKNTSSISRILRIIGLVSLFGYLFNINVSAEIKPENTGLTPPSYLSEDVFILNTEKALNAAYIIVQFDDVFRNPQCDDTTCEVRRPDNRHASDKIYIDNRGKFYGPVIKNLSDAEELIKSIKNYEQIASIISLTSSRFKNLSERLKTLMIELPSKARVHAVSILSQIDWENERNYNLDYIALPDIEKQIQIIKNYESMYGDMLSSTIVRDKANSVTGNTVIR